MASFSLEKSLTSASFHTSEKRTARKNALRAFFQASPMSVSLEHTKVGGYYIRFPLKNVCGDGAKRTRPKKCARSALFRGVPFSEGKSEVLSDDDDFLSLMHSLFVGIVVVADLAKHVVDGRRMALCVLRQFQIVAQFLQVLAEKRTVQEAIRHDDGARAAGVIEKQPVEVAAIAPAGLRDMRFSGVVCDEKVHMRTNIDRGFGGCIEKENVVFFRDFFVFNDVLPCGELLGVQGDFVVLAPEYQRMKASVLEHFPVFYQCMDVLRVQPAALARMNDVQHVFYAGVGNRFPFFVMAEVGSVDGDVSLYALHFVERLRRGCDSDEKNLSTIDVFADGGKGGFVSVDFVRFDIPDF